MFNIRLNEEIRQKLEIETITNCIIMRKNFYEWKIRYPKEVLNYSRRVKKEGEYYGQAILKLQ